MAGDKGSKASTKKADKKTDKKVEKPVDKKQDKKAAPGPKAAPVKPSPAKNGVPKSSKEILEAAQKVRNVSHGKYMCVSLHSTETRQTAR